MNRTDEIRSTLDRAEQVEDFTPTAGTAWHARYRDDIAYLLEVIASYGPDLQEKLRGQAIQIAELRRAIRAQRWVIAALSAALVFGALVGLATVRSEAAARSTAAAGPVMTLPIRVESGGARPLGTYCTQWTATGIHCSGGCIWERWCTNCIPGCDWYLDQECRPTPGANCPFYAGVAGGATGTAASINREGPLADP